MQELLVDFITSLDGYGAAEGWPGWWGLEGPEYLAWLGQQLERDYTILMGANTYRLMSGFATESTTGIPMSPSRWLPAERSTADSSCSSTSPRCSPVHSARTPLPERAPLSEPRDVRVEMSLAGIPSMRTTRVAA